MKTANRFPIVMKTAAALLSAITAVLIGIYLHTGSSAMKTAAISFGTTAYHFVMRLVVGYWIPPVKGTGRWFRPRRWEAPLYRFLRVKSWKKHLPTYDPGQFSLAKHTPQQIVRNMCGAEVVHEVIMVCSFLPLVLVPLFGGFGVFFITSLLSALVDGMFVIAQRYNRPRMERLVAKRR